jgi:phosphinothricin acetyltransferase
LLTTHITPFHKNHFAAAAIFTERLQTGVASFETSAPTWEQWDVNFLKPCRFVALIDNQVAGWCDLILVSKRAVYNGVVEDTIYVARKFRDQDVGKKLLQHLVLGSEQAGFWSLQASIFMQNKSSIRLHTTRGFREIGVREKSLNEMAYGTIIY